MPEKFADIHVDKLHDPWVVLRPVDTSSVDFLELCESIKTAGLILPVSVRPSARFEAEYEIIDGLCRVTACRRVGIDTVPCYVRDATDDQVLILQLQANAVGLPTTHMEYARRLRRLFAAEPKMSLSELSRRCGKAVSWVSQHLGLLELPESVQTMIERGEIPISNAYTLGRLRVRNLRDEFIQHAKVMPVEEFRALVSSVIRREMGMIINGRMESILVDEFEPHPYQRPLSAVFNETKVPREGALVLAAENCQTVIDAWVTALKWTLNLDQASIVRRRRRAVDNLRSHIIDPGGPLNESLD